MQQRARADQAAAQPGRCGRPACDPRGRRTRRRAAARAGWPGAAPRSAPCASAGRAGPCNQGQVLLSYMVRGASSRRRAAQHHSVCRHVDKEAYTCTSTENAPHLFLDAGRGLQPGSECLVFQLLQPVPKARLRRRTTLYLTRLASQLFHQQAGSARPPEVQLAPAAVLGPEGPDVAADSLKCAAAHHNDLLVNEACRMVCPPIKGHARIALVPVAISSVVAEHVREERVPASSVLEA